MRTLFEHMDFIGFGDTAMTFNFSVDRLTDDDKETIKHVRTNTITGRIFDDREEDIDMVHKNGEKYPDHTAGDAIREADKPPEHVRWLCHTVKEIASLIGLEVTERIQVRDKQTGREYR